MNSLKTYLCKKFYSRNMDFDLDEVYLRTSSY